MEVFTSTVYETEHPVVRVLPRTGERSLVLGYFVRRFVGYSQSGARARISRMLVMYSALNAWKARPSEMARATASAG